MLSFFGSRKPSEPDDPGTRRAGDAVEGEFRVLLERWRISEQRVWRSWRAWLAADAPQSATRYRLLLMAMAEEEKAAAAFELLVRMLGANPSASA